MSSYLSRRSFLAGGAGALAITPTFLNQANAQSISAKDFIEQQWNAFRRDQSSNFYGALDRHIFRHVDFNSLSRTVLGSTARGMNDEQVERFAEALAPYIAAEFAGHIRRRIGETPSYTAKRPKNGRQQIDVDVGNITVGFRLYPYGNRWKIYSVTGEGISLGLHLRSRIGRIIDANGRGSQGVEAAIQHMQNRSRSVPLTYDFDF